MLDLPRQLTGHLKGEAVHPTHLVPKGCVAGPQPHLVEARVQATVDPDAVDTLPIPHHLVTVVPVTSKNTLNDFVPQFSHFLSLSLSVILILHFVSKGVLRTAPLMMQISYQELLPRTVVITQVLLLLQNLAY